MTTKDNQFYDSGDEVQYQDGVYDENGHPVPINAEPVAEIPGTAPPVQSALYIDPEAARNDPSKAQGQLARAQWDDFLSRYKPVEDATFSLLNRDPTAEINAAGDAAQIQSDVSQASMQRAAERRGLHITAEQAAAMAAQNKRQDSLAVVGAKNSTTRQIADRNLRSATDMISIGRGIAGSAGTDLGGAADLQQRRNQADEASDAAAKQQRMQMAGTAVGLAAATSSYWVPALMAAL